MKKEIKDRWVKALRSGDYEQGRETLKTPDGKFCCLGVLTDLYLKEKKKSWNDCDLLDSDHRLFSDYGILPLEVKKWSGIDTSNGDYINSKNQYGSLSGLNDNQKLSFKQIANIIDKVWERL